MAYATVLFWRSDGELRELRPNGKNARLSILEKSIWSIIWLFSYGFRQQKKIFSVAAAEYFISQDGYRWYIFLLSVPVGWEVKEGGLTLPLRQLMMKSLSFLSLVSWRMKYETMYKVCRFGTSRVSSWKNIHLRLAERTWDYVSKYNLQSQQEYRRQTDGRFSSQQTHFFLEKCWLQAYKI